MADWLKIKGIVDEAEQADWTPPSWAAALDKLARSDLRILVANVCHEQKLPDDKIAVETLGAVFHLATATIEGCQRHKFLQDFSELSRELGAAGLFVPESVQFLRSTIELCVIGPKDARLRQIAVDALLGSITPSNNGLQAVLMTASILMPLLGASDRKRFIKAIKSLPKTLVNDPLIPSLKLYHDRLTRGEKALETRSWTVKNPLSVITVHSHKGGVGKTTIAIAMASRLAEEGRKVCIVDCDELGPSLHYYLPVKPGLQKNVVFFSDWFCSEGDETAQRRLIEGMVQQVAGSKGMISFVPGSFIGVDLTRLDSAQHSLRIKHGTEAVRDKLRGLIDTLLKVHGFDSVIIDTSPGLKDLSLDVLMACLNVRGSRVFVMRPRAVDIAQLCCEEDWVIKLQNRDSPDLAVINCIPSGEHAAAAIDFTKPPEIAEQLKKWPQFAAYNVRLFQGDFSDMLTEFINVAWEKFDIIPLKDCKSLRDVGLLYGESKDWGALSPRMDDHVRAAMDKIIDNLIKQHSSTGGRDGHNQR